MRKNDMKCPKEAQRLTKSALKTLRGAYRKAVDGHTSGAIEWLRDNYYLIEREARAAIAALRHCRCLPCNGKTPKLYTLCREMIAGGELTEMLNGILNGLDQPLCTAELEALPVMLRVGYVTMAAETIKGGALKGAATAAETIKGGDRKSTRLNSSH